MTTRKETVFAVTTGEYSDYRVEAVYLDEALAEQHARLVDGDVEPYPIMRTAPRKTTSYRASGDLTGEVLCEPWVIEDDKTITWASKRAMKVDVQILHPWKIEEPTVVRVIVEGEDRERVLKVWGERAAWVLAEWDTYSAQSRIEAQELRAQKNEEWRRHQVWSGLPKLPGFRAWAEARLAAEGEHYDHTREPMTSATDILHLPVLGRDIWVGTSAKGGRAYEPMARGSRFTLIKFDEWMGDLLTERLSNPPEWAATMDAEVPER